ncbi:MAG: hypothetical protein WKF83_17905 [Nocardioidaceae bacterium]
MGVEVGELRLPVGASVALVVRGDESFTPHRTMRIRGDDDLLVVAPRRLRDETEARLRALARHGRLAGWNDGTPTATVDRLSRRQAPRGRRPWSSPWSSAWSAPSCRRRDSWRRPRREPDRSVRPAA